MMPDPLVVALMTRTQGTSISDDASEKEVEELNLGDWLWAMLVFFFWFMAIWIFIQIFADIFHRRDLSGGAKAGWILLLFVLPFLGALIYLIARPKMTEQDREDIQRIQEVQRRVSGYSAAEEIEKLSKLRDSGEISAEEYERLKARALVEV
jgi:hypothetical protein